MQREKWKDGIFADPPAGVPMSLPWIGFIVPAALAFWAYRQIRSA